VFDQSEEITMRKFFPGYFTPSQEEFNGIWGECLFGFDASVLLGLYRSSADTQDVFFRILELVADRIFLPNQAAAEYLRNRLGVISIRSDSYKRIREESNKFANAIGLLVQEQSPPRGAEIAAIAKKAADQIGTIIESAAKDEPDRLRSDDLLTRLEALFETKTGEGYPDSMLKEIFEEGARRYEQRIPPGYKDDKKAEPDKYGDLLIWFQLIDKAKVEQKPIIFVTRDAKEDWWLQHREESFGPRPELRQEMAVKAGVQFYMYTAPRFFEFANLFFNVTSATEKAQSEFEKIEKQDKEAAEVSVNVPANFFQDYTGWQTPWQNWQNWNAGFAARQPSVFQPWTFHTEYVPAQTPSARSRDVADNGSRNDYVALLPINGHVYHSSTGKWNCEIVSVPASDANDRARYRLKFEPEDKARQPRYLNLLVSVTGLKRDSDWLYKRAISEVISKWLNTNETSGELAYPA